MNIRRVISTIIVTAVMFAGSAQLTVDWDEICNWTGSGENRAAIGIQFNDGYAGTTYIWGYRWSGSEAPTLRRALCQIAKADRSLCILEQQTAAEKFTLAGVGFDKAGTDCSDVFFDFEAAKADPKLTYDYYVQVGPGDETPALCSAAIAAAASNNVISHPINAIAFSYPAYDYDHWHLPSLSFDRHWNAGWNIGNWIVWKGTAGNDMYEYQGMAYSSREIAGDDVVVLNFNRHSCYPADEDYVDGYTGATRPARPAEYTRRPGGGTSVAETVAEPQIVRITDISGRPVVRPNSPGIYLIQYSDNSTKKIYKF